MTNENENNKGSGKVYKMVGRMTGLMEPYVDSIIYLYIYVIK